MRNECLKTEQKREFTQTIVTAWIMRKKMLIFSEQKYVSFSSDMLIVERKWGIYKDLTGWSFINPLIVLVYGIFVCLCVCFSHLFKKTDNQVQIQSVNILIFHIGKSSRIIFHIGTFCRINVNMEYVVIRTNSIFYITVIYSSNYGAIKQDLNSKTIMTNNKKYVKIWCKNIIELMNKIMTKLQIKSNKIKIK